MVVVRAIARLLVFVIAISAIVIILGAGYWAFASQSNETLAAISVGQASGLRSPQNIEDFFV